MSKYFLNFQNFLIIHLCKDRHFGIKINLQNMRRSQMVFQGFLFQGYLDLGVQRPEPSQQHLFLRASSAFSCAKKSMYSGRSLSLRAISISPQKFHKFLIFFGFRFFTSMRFQALEDEKSVKKSQAERRGRQRFSTSRCEISKSKEPEKAKRPQAPKRYINSLDIQTSAQIT